MLPMMIVVIMNEEYNVDVVDNVYIFQLEDSCDFCAFVKKWIIQPPLHFPSTNVHL